MKVAIDTHPLKSGHSVRGIGTYTKNLVEEFKKGKWKDIEFEFFASPNPPPPVDLIHYPYFDLFFHTLPINKLASRVVVTIHDIIPLVFPAHFQSGFKGKINLLLQKKALRNVDAVICDSKTSKKDISSKFGYPDDKIHVVYLAPSAAFQKISRPDKLSKITKKYNLPKKFVLYVGDVNWTKNIPNLLKAIKISRVNLVMVGKALVDKSLAEVKEGVRLIEKLDIENEVLRIGYIDEDDLVAIYNLASATVLPSYYEGFGLPVLESMACGTPVVCSKLSSLPEVGADLALYCDPLEPLSIAEKIRDTFNLNENLFSKKLIQHASNFSWQKTARETIKVYESFF